MSNKIYTDAYPSPTQSPIPMDIPMPKGAQEVGFLRLDGMKSFISTHYFEDDSVTGRTNHERIASQWQEKTLMFAMLHAIWWDTVCPRQGEFQIPLGALQGENKWQVPTQSSLA